MNYRAEKIDQMIKMINRNLLLISSGQSEDVTPLDFKHLQKVDTSIFGHDKFAYDMVHFIDSFRKNKEYNINKTITNLWEKDFALGLEALLVECALVTDEIERDCFVCRVYRWFTEKLNDRRELPHNNTFNGSYDDLKESVKSLGINTTHTIKGIDNYVQSPNSKKLLFDESETPGKDLLLAAELAHSNKDSFFDKEMTSSRKLLQLSSKSISRNKALTLTRANPLSIPSIFQSTSNNNATSFLPSLSTSIKPESETDKNINDLWLAKRKQEAFDWKSQQQMSLVMDRLSLQKSRMESDTLRRQEANLILEMSKKVDEPLRPLSPTFSDKQRFAPQVRRPFSSKARLHTFKDEESSNHKQETVLTTVGSAVIRVTGPSGVESEVVIPKTSRTVVNKPRTKDTAPMHFGTSSTQLGHSTSRRASIDNNHFPTNTANDEYIKAYERSHHYFQLSDSDEEEPPVRASTVPISIEKGSRKSKLMDRPLTRERPQTSSALKAIAMDDPVIRVHYRYQKYISMKLTDEHEEWLNNREKERTMKTNILLKQLYDANMSKENKKKNKSGDKPNNKSNRSRSKSPQRKSTKSLPSINSMNLDIQMNKEIPDFDEIDINEKSNGPMRINQINEVNQIIEKFTERNLNINRDVLYKALVLPQDLPNDINNEILKNKKDYDNLMINPLPIEYHRKLTEIKKKKKKNGKKKSKK